MKIEKSEARSQNTKPPPFQKINLKKRGTTNHTNTTNILNSFVKPVLFVVKKWDIGIKTIKNSVLYVIKYFGVGTGGLCVLFFTKKTKSWLVHRVKS